MASSADGFHLFPGAADAFLKLGDHGACGVHQIDTVLSGEGVGGGRLAVGADQYAAAGQLGQLSVVDGLQTELFEAVDLHAVVHDVAQAPYGAVAAAEQLFGGGDGFDHAEAEAGFFVDFDSHRSRAVEVNGRGCVRLRAVRRRENREP